LKLDKNDPIPVKVHIWLIFLFNDKKIAMDEPITIFFGSSANKGLGIAANG